MKNSPFSILHSAFFFFLILHSPFFILNSSAIQLTLASTNDYKFVQMPTNWTPQIVGLGCGPDDTSAAIRAEDVFFLNEAMLEREFVAKALRLQATTNSQPYRTTVWALATPIPMSSHMLELGNASTNLFSGTITSNAVGFVTAPKEIHEDPAQHFGAVSSSLDFGHFMTNFYTTGKTQSSHRYYDLNVDARWKIFGSTAYPYPMIVRGVCTNLYHDLAANTFVAFIQPMRTGPDVVHGVETTDRQCETYAIGYGSKSGFNYEPSSQNDRPISINAPFSLNSEIFSLGIYGYRRAYIGCENGSIKERGTGTRKYIIQSGYTGTFAITYSDPIVGSHVTDIKAVFISATMNAFESHRLWDGRQEFTRDETRRLIYPVSFSQGPRAGNGCPSITYTINSDDLMSLVLSQFRERPKTPNELLARCPEPSYPEPGSSTFYAHENWENYGIIINADYVIAVAEVDFRAKQRNNQ